VPEQYAASFAGASDVLATHRAYDSGALEVARAVAARETVLHVSVHSFTPVLRGEVRACDVGMELEINQKHVGGRDWRALIPVLGATLATAVELA
jgi:predicted N-formylglutamate amidohydrolase